MISLKKRFWNSVKTLMRSTQSNNLVSKKDQYHLTVTSRIMSFKVTINRLWIAKFHNCLAPNTKKLLNQAINLHLCNNSMNFVTNIRLFLQHFYSMRLSLATRSQPIHQRSTRILTIPMRQKPKRSPLFRIKNVLTRFLCKIRLS